MRDYFTMGKHAFVQPGKFIMYVVEHTLLRKKLITYVCSCPSVDSSELLLSN